jgi:hypothetical protein
VRFKVRSSACSLMVRQESSHVTIASAVDHAGVESICSRLNYTVFSLEPARGFEPLACALRIR